MLHDVVLCCDVLCCSVLCCGVVPGGAVLCLLVLHCVVSCRGFWLRGVVCVGWVVAGVASLCVAVGVCVLGMGVGLMDG